MLALFARVGTVHMTGRSGGTEEVDVHLPNHSPRAIPANAGPAHRREQTGRDLTKNVLTN